MKNPEYTNPADRVKVGDYISVKGFFLLTPAVGYEEIEKFFEVREVKHNTFIAIAENGAVYEFGDEDEFTVHSYA